MAVSKVILRWPFKAAEDLSAKQFTVVKINESSEIEVAASGSVGFILMDTPKAGEYGTVCMEGVEKAVCAATIKVGQFVSANNKGELQVAVTGQYVVGTALETGESGALIPVLCHPGSGAKV